MISLNTYKKAYQKCEDILDILGCATSGEILYYLLLNHNIYHLKITPKGITYYLKQQGYQGRKYYKTKAYIFFSKKYSGVLLE